jgi:DHA1 family bicyclomycin/chloramphenicol resistance-like MFS transporter
VAVLASIVFDAGLAGLLPAFFVLVSSIGLVMPNATALALADHSREAGSASALLGMAQFVFGAGAAPLVGVAGTGTATPMALVIAALSLAALLPFLLLTRTRGR